MYNKKIIGKNIYNLTKYITPKKETEKFFLQGLFLCVKNRRFGDFFPVLLDIVRKRLYNTIE